MLIIAKFSTIINSGDNQINNTCPSASTVPPVLASWDALQMGRGAVVKISCGTAGYFYLAGGLVPASPTSAIKMSGQS